MRVLVLQELYFFLSLLGLYFFPLQVTLFNCVDLCFQLNNFKVLSLAPCLKLFNAVVQVCLTMLGLNLFTHGKGNTRLVESLVSSDRHFNFVTDSQQQQTSLGLSQRYLSNNFIKALRKEFFPDWTDSAFTCLALHQFLVKHFSQTGNVNTGGLLVTHILDVVLAIFIPFSRGQNSV